MSTSNKLHVDKAFIKQIVKISSVYFLGNRNDYWVYPSLGKKTKIIFFNVIVEKVGRKIEFI